MCKILAFTNTKKIKMDKHLNKIGNTLLALEDDGFGYAVQGTNGMFGEKTIDRKFKSRLNATNLITYPIFTPKNEAFGVKGALTGPGIFHGRTSTNVGGLINTHPMQRDGWNLIHNGVVTDVGLDNTYDTISDNDSEFVLYRLIQGIKAVQESLEGYYAFAAIDPEGRLHICRDRTATLFVAYSASYETYVIATTEELLVEVSRFMNAKIGPVEEIDEDLYMIFQGNEMIHMEQIKSKGYTRRQSVFASRSLGREIPFEGVITHNRGNGDIRDVTRSGSHHRASHSDMSEAELLALNNMVESSINEFVPEDEEETDYYKYVNELENMDASYQIYLPDNKQIDLFEFRRLDGITKEMCTILRADGTLVEPDYSTERLRYGN